MAGYLGTKAVLLSTTAADVVGNAEIGGDLTVGGNALFSDNSKAIFGAGSDLQIYHNTSASYISDQGSGPLNVLGSQVNIYNAVEDTQFASWNASAAKTYIDGSLVTNTTSTGLEISSNNATIQLTDTDDSGYSQIRHNTGSLIFEADKGGTTGSSAIRFDIDGTERMRIGAAGNLLVGTMGSDPHLNSTGTTADNGTSLDAAGYFSASSYQGVVGFFNRTDTDGSILQFRKDGSSVGSIGVDSGNIDIDSKTGTGLLFGGSRIQPKQNGALADNAVDMGALSYRFDDIYATNGTIQTSDRNEKQDIEALSDAEQRVAVACKGLLRKFRWKDAVAEKGDNARIHFGIIAQDLQDAFTAEGLDAGRYAMFISSTWWETQTEVPAVEAVAAVDAVYEDVVIPAVEEVLDEEGNVVTEAQPERIEQRLVTEAVEAVEAKEAYTRTDTYETLEEAPEGATERTRLGVRYPELLAFIIGAM